MGSEVREFDYRPKWTTIVLCGGFFALCTTVLGTKAANNDRGVVINHVIELGPGGATIFYWILTALSAAFVVTAAFLVYHRIALQQRLIFGPIAMTVPAGRWSREELEIAYRDVIGLSETAVNGQRLLNVAHAGGKYTVSASMLPSKAEYTEVCELLAARVREAHAPGSQAGEPGGAQDPQVM